ncbi:MAG: hypothetical protein BWY66_02169 [bacterium ADurb.Bin374]|nr:MAG: hypothetical protein BWY66_02169 [bacterium ADurb.Bin374]
MSPANKKSDEIRKAAERMRRDGRSLNDIAEALGVREGTVCKWAKAGGWPDPRDHRRQTQAAVRQIVTAAIDPIAPIDPTLFEPEKLEKVAENVILYALRQLVSVPTAQNLKAALDASVRIYLAKEEAKEIRQFQIMVPEVTETFPPTSIT